MNEAQQARAREEISRGQRAKGIYEDQLFVGAVAAIQDQVWSDFRSCDPADAKKLTECRLRLDALGDICASLKRHMETGRLARAALDRFFEATEKAKQKLRRVA